MSHESFKFNAGWLARLIRVRTIPEFLLSPALVVGRTAFPLESTRGRGVSCAVIHLSLSECVVSAALLTSWVTALCFISVICPMGIIVPTGVIMGVQPVISVKNGTWFLLYTCLLLLLLV